MVQLATPTFVIFLVVKQKTHRVNNYNVYL